MLLSVHTFSLVESPFSRIRGGDFRHEQLSQCLDAPLIAAAPHYGLRYGCAPATGHFQRLRGRPPLVSPLKPCMGRSFTAVTRVRIPSGTPNLFQQLPRFSFSKTWVWKGSIRISGSKALRRKRSMARRFAVAVSHAAGLSETPDCGHCSGAAASVSCARSTARSKSRVRRRPDVDR